MLPKLINNCGLQNKKWNFNNKSESPRPIVDNTVFDQLSLYSTVSAIREQESLSCTVRPFQLNPTCSLEKIQKHSQADTEKDWNEALK